MPAPLIREATSAADFEGFGELCRAYFAWCRDRYRDMPWFVDEVFGHQSFETELQGLAEKYGPPRGRTFVATIDDMFVAAGAYQRLSDDVCELKRLYVSDAGRGCGTGRDLSRTLAKAAKKDGFSTVRLDTAHLLTEAITMYRSMGFTEIAPYRAYPERLLPYLVFMEKRLDSDGISRISEV